MALLADFIAWPDREEIVLAEVTPSLTLAGFILSVPFVNTYKLQVPRQYLSSLIVGGVYRRVVGVRQDATDLTQRSSITDVENNAGSWYWDEATGDLYVRVLGTPGDPDDVAAAMQAFVTYYMATKAKVLERAAGDPSTGVYYWPWLMGEMPRISSEVEDPFHGLKMTEGGIVRLVNTHKFFSHAFTAHNWKNKRLRLFWGGSYRGLELTRSQYLQLRTLRIEDMAPGELECEIQLGPFERVLETTAPPTSYGFLHGGVTEAAPNLGDGVKGTLKPLLYGRAVVKPDLIDNSGFGVYLVADAQLQTLFALNIVYATPKQKRGVRVQLTEGVDYSKNLTTCRVTVLEKAGVPGAPTVAVQGATGSTAYTYKIAAGVFLSGLEEVGLNLASSGTTVTNGNSVLSTTNFNRVSWTPVAGAGVYAIYRDDRLVGFSAFGASFDDTNPATLSGNLPEVNRAGYHWRDFEIEADATGKPDGAGSYYKTFTDIGRELLKTVGGVQAADIDETYFGSAAIQAPEELAVSLKEPRSLASIFATTELGRPSLERSVMGRVFQGPDGRWRANIWQPDVPDTVPALRKEDFIEFRPEPKLETVYPWVRVHHTADYARNEWLIEFGSSTVDKSRYLSETPEDETLNVYTYLRDAAKAAILAQRYQFMASVIPLEVEVVERGSRLAQWLAGDKLRVTYDPAPVPGGSAINKPFEILRLDISFDPVLRISGRLGDLRGIAAFVGYWMASTAPDWSTATAQEREASGFWSDSAGLINPADPATKDLRRWW